MATTRKNTVSKKDKPTKPEASSSTLVNPSTSNINPAEQGTNPFVGINPQTDATIPSIDSMRRNLEQDTGSGQTIIFGGLPLAPAIKSGENVAWGDHNIHNTEKQKSVDMTKATQEDHPFDSVKGPIEGVSQDNEHYTAAEIHFIACKAFTELLRNESNARIITERVEAALELGSAYNGRRISKSNLSRTQERVTFKTVLKLLNETLSLIYRYDFNGVTGYELDEAIYKNLCAELIKLRTEAYDSLISSGRGIPILPRWGRDGNIRTVWSKNDFEIVGAAYRAEVEFYLAKLAKGHHFQGEEAGEDNKHEVKIREDNKHETKQAPELPSQEKNEEASTPHVEEQEAEYESDARTESSYQKFRKAKENTTSYHAETTDSISQAFRSNNLRHSKAWNPISAFGQPLQNSNGKGYNDLFARRGGSDNNKTPVPDKSDESKRPPRREKESGPNKRPIANAPNPGPPDGDDDDDDDGNPGGRRPNNHGNPGGNPPGNSSTIPPGRNPVQTVSEPQFDNKLKVDIIPTWDGDLDSLGRWVLKINRLSERSRTVYKQLGVLVPTRLTGAAETWYYSQSSDIRERIEANWGTLREAFGAYYMNRAYMDRQKARANRAGYRDAENLKESPSEYFIRKLELLDLVYNYTDVELINEIMAGAPSYWVSILTPHLYQKLDEFQLAIKFHEHNLTNMDLYQTNRPYGYSNRNPFSKFRNARTNLVGWSKATSNPPFPKDDLTISPRGTPEDKGARPCRHCGSGKHWDPDCKYARKGEKRARVNAVVSSNEDIVAQEEYDSLYFEDVSDEEQDF